MAVTYSLTPRSFTHLLLTAVNACCFVSDSNVSYINVALLCVISTFVVAVVELVWVKD